MLVESFVSLHFPWTDTVALRNIRKWNVTTLWDKNYTTAIFSRWKRLPTIRRTTP